MIIYAKIVKFFLNILAKILRLRRDNIYYLVSGPLREDIQEVNHLVFAYQHIEHAIWLAQNRFSETSKGVIADIGGGTATTATLFSKYLPFHDIYIFEPIKDNFQTIENANARTPHWILFNQAVGDQLGVTEINIAERVTASSLLEMDSNIDGYGDILKTKGKESISITTLDATLPQDKFVDILKLDVQGFEMKVLKGANETLKRTKVIVLEVNNHNGYKGAPTYFEIDDFMRQNDFELFDLLPNFRESGKLLDWDAIYVNKFLLK